MFNPSQRRLAELRKSDVFHDEDIDVKNDSQEVHSYDSRKYSTSRLTSYWLYEALPPFIDDLLAIELPAFYQHSGRFVAVGNNVLELWSPNSEQLPYLSGALSPSFTWNLPEQLEHRRYDGHLGRYDPTISPQVFSKDVPWLGLVIRPARGIPQGLPEFMPLHEYWQSTSQDEGVISPRLIGDLRSRILQLLRDVDACSCLEKFDAVLWANQPRKPTLRDIHLLVSLTKYDIAIDQTVRVQREARIMAAWLKMARIILNRGMRLALWTTIPPANDDYIGTWINGSGDHDGEYSRDILWLLHHHVPCFIAHTLTAEEQRSLRAKGVRVLKSLVSETDAESLGLKDNQYDLIAYHGGCQPTTVGPILEPPPKQVLPSNDRLRSSSYKQGWTGALCGYQRLPEPQRPNEDDTTDKDNPPVPLPLPKYVQKDWEYDSSRLEYVEIDPGRVPFLRPPPVSPVAKIRDKWTRWRITHTDDGDVMRRSNCSSGGKYCFYDRALHRELHFGRKVPPPLGHLADTKVFGQPVPNLRFETNVHGKYTKQDKSQWMYTTREEPSHVGRVAHVPHPEALPLRPMDTEHPAVHDFLTSLGWKLISKTTAGCSARNDPALNQDPPQHAPSCNHENDTGTPHTLLPSPGASTIVLSLRSRSISPMTTLATSSTRSPPLPMSVLTEMSDVIMKSKEPALQSVTLSTSPAPSLPALTQVISETDVIMQFSRRESSPYRERSVSLGSEVDRVSIEPSTSDFMIVSPAQNSFASPAQAPSPIDTLPATSNMLDSPGPSPSGLTLPPRDLSIKLVTSPSHSPRNHWEPSPYRERSVSLGSEVSRVGQDPSLGGSMSPARNSLTIPPRSPPPVEALPMTLDMLPISPPLGVNGPDPVQALPVPATGLSHTKYNTSHFHPAAISAPSDPQGQSTFTGPKLSLEERIGEVRPFHQGKRSGRKHKGGKRNEGRDLRL